ncbi:hypothetical protein [Nocardia australiensis]|uniref:hypothetical protein n=1 Tax=Nocardia australiensis TaxID=2887191 RepID=UPI001D139A13|nr:hypothetical protein [Nocardia australiensis]
MTTDHRDHSTEKESQPIAFQQHEVSESIRAHSTTADPDYIDQFTLTTNAAAIGSPEQWARASLEDAAGLKGQAIWRVLLGLRLAWRSSPEQVAYWPIVDRGDTWITLSSHSWMLTGSLVIEVDDDHASLATFIRYERSIGERIWTTVSANHRSLAPSLLRAAWNIQKVG